MPFWDIRFLRSQSKQCPGFPHLRPEQGEGVSRTFLRGKPASSRGNRKQSAGKQESWLSLLGHAVRFAVMQGGNCTQSPLGEAVLGYTVHGAQQLTLPQHSGARSLCLVSWEMPSSRTSCTGGLLCPCTRCSAEYGHSWRFLGLFGVQTEVLLLSGTCQPWPHQHACHLSTSTTRWPRRCPPSRSPLPTQLTLSPCHRRPPSASAWRNSSPSCGGTSSPSRTRRGTTATTKGRPT